MRQPGSRAASSPSSLSISELSAKKQLHNLFYHPRAKQMPFVSAGIGQMLGPVNVHQLLQYLDDDDAPELPFAQEQHQG